MIKKLFFLLILIVVALVLGRNFLIKNGAAFFVNAKSGMTLSIGRFNVGLVSSKLEIENLELLNSARFSKERMVSVPKMIVDISLPKLVSGQLYFKTLQLNLEELTIVRNKQGTLNLKDFQGFKSGKKKEKAEEKKSGKETSFFIEDFELHIGKVVYKDYMVEGAPNVQAFKVGLNKKLSNVDSVSTLINTIVFEALSKTSIPTLLDQDINEITNVMQEALLKKAQKSINKFQKELDKLAPTTAE